MVLVRFGEADRVRPRGERRVRHGLAGEGLAKSVAPRAAGKRPADVPRAPPPRRGKLQAPRSAEGPEAGETLEASSRLSAASSAAVHPERPSERAPPPPEKDRDTQLVLSQQLGQGGFGRVHLADCQRTGTQYAVKTVVVQQDAEQAATRRALLHAEVALQGDLRHRHIVQALWHRVTTKADGQVELRLVLEFLPGGSLRELLRAGPLAEEVVVRYARQLALGVAHLHTRLVCHRDLKCDNLLLDARHAELKIADFGLARAVTTPHMPFTREVVTLWYRAPEILLGSSRYSTPVDMWSCGCILAEMATGSALFNGDSEFGTLMRIFELCGTPNDENFPGVTELPHFNRNFPQWKRPKFETVLASGPNLTEPGLALLQSLLTYPTTERITPRKACRHTYFSGLDISGYDTGHLQSIDVHLGLA